MVLFMMVELAPTAGLEPATSIYARVVLFPLSYVGVQHAS